MLTGGSYGGSQHYNQQSVNFWGLGNDYKRTDANFNYFNLGNGPKINPDDNAVLSYPGSKYDQDKGYEQDKDKNYYGNLWTRRPGQDGNISIHFLIFYSFIENFFCFLICRLFGEN